MGNAQYFFWFISCAALTTIINVNFHNYHHHHRHHHQANAAAYEDVQALIRINNVRVCWWEERGATILCASLHWASAQSHRSPSQLVGDFSNREAYSPLHSKLHRSLFKRLNSIYIYISGFCCFGCLDCSRQSPIRITPIDPSIVERFRGFSQISRGAPLRSRPRYH